MDRARAWLEQNRRIALPVLAVVVAVLVFWVFSRILGGPAAEAPAPAPPAAAPAPAPAPAAPPAAEQPAPAPRTPSAAVVAVGRSDPFAPLVTEPRAAPPAGAGTRPTPLPPPPLPLPPLPPGTPGAGTPGAPQAQPAPPPPPEAGITVLGIISDARSLVIVSINGKTEIIFEGEAVGDLRVIKIDPVRGVVTFERAGKRFDLKIGGG